MKIGPLGGESPQLQPREKPPLQSAKSESQDRPDRVEISLAARKQLAESADNKLKKSMTPDSNRDIDSAVALPEEKADIDPKLALLRQRISSGFYDRPEVQQEIARKLADEL